MNSDRGNYTVLSTLVHKISYLLLLVFVLWLVVGSILADDYKVVNGGRDDYIYIQNDGKTVIQPTVVSYDFALYDTYIVGLRFPVLFLSCGGDYANKLKVVNNREYFILNRKIDDLVYFDSKEVFQGELKRLGIENVSLDYSRFDKLWTRYNGYYKRDEKHGGDAGCIEVDSPLK